MHAILPRKPMKPLQTRGTLGVTIGCLQLACSPATLQLVIGEVQNRYAGEQGTH